MNNTSDNPFRFDHPLPHDSAVYLMRGSDVEDKALQLLERMDWFTINEPKQCGKTSLISWLRNQKQLLDAGYSFTSVDMSMLANTTNVTEEMWYKALHKYLLTGITGRSGYAQIWPTKYPQPRTTPYTNSTYLFHSEAEWPPAPLEAGSWHHFLFHLAERAFKAKQRLIIVLDRMTQANLQKVWIGGCFRALRHMLDNRPLHHSLDSLAFIFVGTYDIKSLIPSPDESDFSNITHVHLPDFTEEQVKELVTHLHLPAEEIRLITDSIYYWTAGHPYLTQLLCYHLAELHQLPTIKDVDRIVVGLCTRPSAHFSTLLRALKEPDLRKWIERLLRGYKPKFSPLIPDHLQQLKLMGLINTDDEFKCTIRNQLYKKLLEDALEVIEAEDREERLTAMPGIPNDVHNRIARPKSRRTSAFISYSRKDQRYLQELQTHLAYYIQKEKLNVWDDTRIHPGTEWREEIAQALQSAKVAVLLVSADFLASDFIVNNELPPLLTAAKQEGVIILCVHLRRSAFKDTEMAQFQSVNDPSNPLGTMTRAKRDEVWTKVAELVWKTLSDGREEPVAKQTPISNATDSFPPSTPKAPPPPHIASQEEHSAVPPFTVANTSLTSKSTIESHHPSCDICVICSMDEEVETFIHEASHLCHVTFQSAFGPHTKRKYRYATIENNKGEPVTLCVTWPPSSGPEETGLHLKPVLDELKPRFAAMTGICAGDKKKVALGDIIVAERAFRYDTGKFVLGKRGRKIQQNDTSTRNLDPNILHFVRMFNGWKSAVTGLKRPISKQQQRDWLLSTLLKAATPRVDNIPSEELEQHAPNWKKIVYELQTGSPRYLDDDRMLSNPARVRELYFGSEDFPFQDPAQPRRYIAPMASGSTVRSDNPFEEIRTPVRGTIAIDMEGATFYRTVSEFPALRSLLVKGVCDYADPDKDDSYHEYAAAVSAIYMLCFIKEYVNDDRMPRG